MNAYRTCGAVLVLAVSFSAFSATTVVAKQTIKASGGGVAVGNVSGGTVTISVGNKKDHKSIKKIEQNTDRILKLLQEAKGQQDLQNEKYVVQLEQENQQLKIQLAALAASLAHATQPGANNTLADQAVQGLKRGNLKYTSEYLLNIEKNEAAKGAEADSRAAAAARQLAVISDTRTAVAALQRATEYEPDNVANWTLLGDMQVQAGDLHNAELSYRTMFRLTDAVSLAHPRDNDLLRNLSVSHDKIGDIQQAQGDLAGALDAYRASLKIRERLAQHDPNNTGWQRDLSVSHDNIGDIQQAQGDLAGALDAYRASLKIRERLCAA